MPIRLIAVLALAVVPFTCVGCGPSNETAVLNSTGVPVIAWTHDSTNFPDPDPVDRFFVIRPGELIVVDAAGGQDPPTDRVVILDTACHELERVTDDFSDGALISLADGEQPKVDLGRASASGFVYLVQPNANGLNGENGFSSCSEAATKLAPPA